MEQAKMLTLEDCESVIKKRVKTDHIETVGFSVTHLENDNFSIKITINENGDKKTFNFFGKCVASLEKSNNILEDFKTKLPEFDTKITPAVYFIKSRFVIYEDLSEDGFTNSSDFNLIHTQITLETLAKLHAASFAYEELKTGKDGVKNCLEKEYDLKHQFIDLKDERVKKIISSALAETNSRNVDNVIEDFENRLSSSKFPKTLNHGNLIPTNVMFKMQENSPVETKLINFQQNLYISPACDFLQLLFFCSTEPVLQYYFEFLLSFYYDSLSKEMKKYNIDIEKILTKEDWYLAVFNFIPLMKLKKAQYFTDDKSLEELEESLKCPLISREECYILVKNKIGNSDFKFVSYNVSHLNDVSGFLGVYHNLCIKIEYSNQEKIIKCFVKCTPLSGSPQAIAKDLGSSIRESFMYGTLVPMLLQREIVTIKECLPACYFQRPGEMLVFEDLSAQNFRGLSALEPYDFNLLALSVKKLATFHGSFLVFEEKMTAEVGRPYRIKEEFIRYFDEPLFFIDKKHLGARSFMTGIKSVFDATELFPEIKTEKNQENFKEFWPKLKDLFYTVTKTSDRFRNVLSHGDIWTSNILVKLDGELPVDCKILDFQIIRYCPPGYDLLSILHLTTHRSIRMQHEEEIKEIYYKELSQTLDNYNYDIEKIYPYGDFKACVDYMKPQMVLQAAVDVVLTMCTPEEISSFLTNDEMSNYVYFEDRKEFLTEMCKKSPRYRKRLQECILDIYDYCDLMCSQK